MRKDKNLTARAQVLRRRQTKAERLLWKQLANRQIAGAKFRRQQPIGRYIVDFVSFERRLVIEVDGGHHDEDDTRISDEDRTSWFEANGYKIIRFWNNEVEKNLDGVLERILEALHAKPHPHLSPLPSRERRLRGHQAGLMGNA